MTRTTSRIIAASATLAMLGAGIGAAQAAPARDYEAYYENTQRFASPHAYSGEAFPHFAETDHEPHYDAWGRNLNGPPFRTSCNGLYYGTGDHSCGSMTGGPAGGLESRN